MPPTQTRTRILDSAARLMAANPAHAVTLDAVARQAGVGKGTIYLHFTDKDDLFFQTVTQGFEELCQQVRQVADCPEPFDRHIESICLMVSHYFRRRRKLLAVIGAEEASLRWESPKMQQRWQSMRRHLIDAVSGVLDSGIKHGLLRGDLPAEALAVILLGMIRSWHRDLDDRHTVKGCIKLLVDLFLQGATQPEASQTSSPSPARNALT